MHARREQARRARGKALRRGVRPVPAGAPLVPAVQRLGHVIRRAGAGTGAGQRQAESATESGLQQQHRQAVSLRGAQQAALAGIRRFGEHQRQGAALRGAPALDRIGFVRPGRGPALLGQAQHPGAVLRVAPGLAGHRGLSAFGFLRQMLAQAKDIPRQREPAGELRRRPIGLRQVRVALQAQGQFERVQLDVTRPSRLLYRLEGEQLRQREQTRQHPGGRRLPLPGLAKQGLMDGLGEQDRKIGLGNADFPQPGGDSLRCALPKM
ncbi:hypothetical protein GALL_277900 [mine drainage metagenome]|uniref:Uncharacterized protein n=1 Tax=mine drainage metagenome TaxID=410659 RepID=A0A1J5R2V4_9ZZZZ